MSTRFQHRLQSTGTAAGALPGSPESCTVESRARVVSVCRQAESHENGVQGKGVSVYYSLKYNFSLPPPSPLCPSSPLPPLLESSLPSPSFSSLPPTSLSLSFLESEVYRFEGLPYSDLVIYLFLPDSADIPHFPS